MDEIKIIPLYFFTLNEPKCNWNSLKPFSDAWNYSMNYYEVKGVEKVKKSGISISPISQTAKQKHYNEHSISGNSNLFHPIQILVTFFSKLK